MTAPCINISIDSISGVVLVSLSDRDLEPEIPLGALWALIGALLYATYLVLLRRRVDNEIKLNVPMFFGKSFNLINYKSQGGHSLE